MATQNPSLRQLVTLLADEPTFDNRDGFYHSLLISKVGARLPDDYRPIQDGQALTTTATDQIGVPTTTGPDGSPMLLVYCDIPTMNEHFPNDQFFEIDGRVVLEMAQTAGCGIIVQNVLDGKPSWAGVSKDDVTDILNAKYA